MAATVTVRRLNSTGPSTTDITSTTNRASTSDAVAPGTANPIPVPTVGSTSIASSTNATPIVVTATAHGLSNGQMVCIVGHTTNTNANGTWKIANITANTFEITGRAGNGVGGASGTVRQVNCSFWVVTQLSVDVAPSNGINNIKWYADASNTMGTGVTIKVATATSYVQATGTTGTTGDALSPATTGAYGATLSGVPVDPWVQPYSVGAPLSVAGSIANTTGVLGDRVVYQVEVNSLAGAGTTGGPEALTFAYDET